MRMKSPPPTIPAPAAYTEGVLEQNWDRVVSSLREDPSQALLAFSNLNTTLLHAACYDGRVDITELLISLGAEVDAREVGGRTPMHHAANNGHVEVIDVLVRHGANLELKDNAGMTALMWANISRSARRSECITSLEGHGAV